MDKMQTKALSPREWGHGLPTMHSSTCKHACIGIQSEKLADKDALSIAIVSWFEELCVLCAVCA